MTVDILPSPLRSTVKAAIKKQLGVTGRWVDLAGLPGIEAAEAAAVQDWWHSAPIDDVLRVVDNHADKRVRALAALLCAESVGHLTTDLRVAECRRVTLAWVRGTASDSELAVAVAAAWDAAKAAARDALAAPLRSLVQDPSRFGIDSMLRRWDIDVVTARGLFTGGAT